MIENYYILMELFYINRHHFSSLYSTGLAANRIPETKCMCCKSSHRTRLIQSNQCIWTRGQLKWVKKYIQKCEETWVREEVFYMFYSKKRKVHNEIRQFKTSTSHMWWYPGEYKNNVRFNCKTKHKSFKQINPIKSKLREPKIKAASNII